MDVCKGMRVELCSDEDGYGGAWFEGTVIDVGSRNGTFKIQYDKFVTEDGVPLVEDVEFDHMRPIPPSRPLRKNCSIGDAVEVHDTDCWWRGIVVKKLVADCGTEILGVYFPDSRTIKFYPRSKLRPAQAWIGGAWTASFEKIFEH